MPKEKIAQPRLVRKKLKNSYTICVSGAARGQTVEKNAQLAFNVGKYIALQGHTLITGATIGLPDWAAKGAKSVGGLSIGISPASSKHEHIKKYGLPTDGYDFILYSGLRYVGRDGLLIQSSDAVLSIGGRMGTLHEFATAVESKKPVGVVEGAGGVGDEFESLMVAAGMCYDGICDSKQDVFFSEDPELLVKKIVSVLEERHKKRTLIP